MRAALAPCRLPRDTAVALAFVDDAAIRALNARHRGIDRVTDVLSFGAALPARAGGQVVADLLSRDPDGSLELGDVVIAPERARRQARRRGWRLAEEIAFLAAHGALHLVGYTDDTPTGYREMRRLGEDALRRGRMLLRRRAKQN